MLRSLSPSVQRYLLREALLLLSFPYLLLLAATSNGVVNYDLSRFSLGMLTVVVMVWVGASLWRGRGGATPASSTITTAHLPLGRPLALFLAVYLLTAFTSIDPRRSLADAWLAGAYGFAFLLAADLVNRGWPRELFVKAMLITGGILMGMGMYTLMVDYGRWLAANPGVWLPAIPYRLPGSNTVAIFLNLLLMMALARLWSASTRASRILLLVWIILALGLILLTGSRGAWLGTVAGIAVWVWLMVRGPGRERVSSPVWEFIHRRRALSRLILLVGVIAVGLLGWVAYRLATHPIRGSSFFAVRGIFWLAAWQAFQRSPWVGQGPFTYGSAFVHVRSVPPERLYIHAHSLYFNLLAETGLVGVIAFGVLGVAAFRALWQQLKTLCGDEHAVAAGALIALVAYAVHGIFEGVSVEPSNAFLISILMGIALAPGPATDRPGNRPARRWPVIGLALMLVSVGWYGLWLSTPHHLGVLAANKDEWRQAAMYFEEAARRDSRSAVTHQQWGLAQSVLAAQGEAGALAEAVREFETTVRLDPDWALNHANLGALYAAQGEVEAALNELRAAVGLAPRVAVYHLNLGVAAERAGRAAEAEQAYAEALTLRPDWAEAYFWRATPFRSEFFARWRVSNPAVPAPALAELEQAVAANSEQAVIYAQLAEVYIEAGRLSEAERLLRRAEVSYAGGEQRLESLWAAAALAAAQGDYHKATTFGEKAFAGYRDQSIFGPGTFGDPSYGPFYQRRETMVVDMVPQLTLIRLTDPWAARMVRLGDWYAALGDIARAASIYREVLAYVPDSAEAQARLK